MSTPRATTPSGARFWVPAGIALTVHLAIGFFYLASGLMAPSWAVILLGLVWLAFTAAWVHWVRRRSWWNLTVPVAAVVAWLAVMTLGEQLLGWTA